MAAAGSKRFSAERECVRDIMVCSMSVSKWQSVLIANPDGVRVRVKVVPGSSRTRLAGLLGDRLKVAVSAPPEGGRANKAVCELLADVFGIPKRQVEVVEGRTRPRKTLEVTGLRLRAATECLRRGGPEAGR